MLSFDGRSTNCTSWTKLNSANAIPSTAPRTVSRVWITIVKMAKELVLKNTPASSWKSSTGVQPRRLPSTAKLAGERYTWLQPLCVQKLCKSSSPLRFKKHILIACRYGQTNCFVGTAIKYGVFAVNDQEAFLCTTRAMRNMTFQGITATRGEILNLVEVPGASLVGTKVKAPYSIYPEVYVLPMDNVLATKGTGVVTSVPSDSPDDFQTLTDLRKKHEYYKIDPSWAAFDPVPLISTPTYGDMVAPAVVKQLKILSQKDTKQLIEAKEIAYKEGFYNGTMTIGKYKGETVQVAKPKVRTDMIAEGLAFAYAEPEGLVISRSADECVVALMDQWYLDYGETEWRAQTEKYVTIIYKTCVVFTFNVRMVAKMEMYIPETRNAFEKTLAWLNKWACARTYGLGSDLPWDKHFMVESLSDSTIYMCYYTVAQLLHGQWLSHPINGFH